MNNFSLGLIAFLAIALVLAGCTQGGTNVAGNADAQAHDDSEAPTAVMVEFTSSGLNPATVTVHQGGTVTWKNMDSRSHWPASAVHPTHTVYPGSGIEKCSTAEQVNIFDACAEIPAGGEWSFTFNEVGEWKYHDHMNVGPPYFGTVKVVE